MEGSNVFDIEHIGLDAFGIQEFNSFLDYAPSRAPANQGDIGISRTFQLRSRQFFEKVLNLAIALLHDHAAGAGRGEHIRDEDALFIVIVSGRYIVAVGSARQGARRDTRRSEFEALELALIFFPLTDHFTAIDFDFAVEYFRVYCLRVLRKEQVGHKQNRKLIFIGQVEDFYCGVIGISNRFRSHD
ncbi:MAG: hypothetical protein BWY75_01166 [bacterium ADurb.Bin425]|nr:MAG: hypothetical protein BWY75_01166 [bacterium ADurb.Bin425]